MFGSPHPGNMNMLLCDGSVAAVSYDVDERVHLWMGMRNDGQVLDERD
ncbi:MAG: DUF1559 domain-containing protein [Planctomycetes bacterium]|nr:DUF1559 domain-containing protein [Planctomycetota bacterium]